MPRIKFLKSDRGTNDGIKIKYFDEGIEYDVSEELAHAFVKHRKTAVIIETAVAPVLENASIDLVVKKKEKNRKAK